MTNPNNEKRLKLAQDIVARAQKAGAKIAEAMVKDGSELSIKVRKGKPELVEEAAPKGVGLRVIIDNRSAITYTNDTTEAGLEILVQDAIEVAALSQPDEFNLPPDSSLLASEFPDLDLCDTSAAELDASEAIRRAIEGEKAADAFDERITNTEGTTFGRNLGGTALATSGGFSGSYDSSFYSMVVNPIAEVEGEKMQVGYHWDAKRYLSEMQDPAAIGEEAARRTLAKLGAQKVETCEAPVVFDPDTGRALLAALFQCLSGSAIYKRTSYLLDQEGESIASDIINIVDDPLIPRGPGSRPFDGDGLSSRKNVVVENGVLKTYLLDTYSARKLDRESTGNASRGIGSSPSVAPSNLHLLPGEQSPEDIIKEVKSGLYVTSMMGFGFNPVTGDFSRGAEGFWIENGEKTKPVGEITISLNFKDLWKRIDALGNDLITRTAIATPTFRVSEMTIAGS